jgi:hypothetical protein
MRAGRHLRGTALALLLAAPLAAEPQRPIVVISDLHMGLGRQVDGSWDPTEDFRWPRALSGFLDHVSSSGGDRVDLVIAGDFLERWPRPPREGDGEGDEPPIRCAGASADYGCTVAEMERLTQRVLDAHGAEMAALAAFAARGSNCVHVLAGNHDAALLLPGPWNLVKAVLESAGGCVSRPDDGVWVSATGYLVSEHGNQIGHDPNRYPEWPRVTRVIDGVEYLERPWGEAFVQRLFNEEERVHPMVDNLSPWIAGLRYRLAENGIGGLLADTVDFIKFNLLDTSWRQAARGLGDGRGGAAGWDVAAGRAMGHRLFAGALPDGDPFRDHLLAGDGEWRALRERLDAQALDTAWLTDEEVRALCDQLALLGRNPRCGVDLGLPLAQRLGSLFEHQRVVAPHVASRSQAHPRMGAFAYGHTHAFELPWKVPRPAGGTTSVLNSGAFQRLVDDHRLRELAAERGIEVSQVLRALTPDDLAPCYAFVEVRWYGDTPHARLSAWHMGEGEPAGRRTDPCGPLCPDVGHGCDDR